MFYFHQGGHGGAPPDVLVNLWFTRYLYGVHNGVEDLPRSWVVREAASCPPRQTTVTGDQSNTATLAVADASPFSRLHADRPADRADGTITNTTRLITDIPDSTHLVLASAVATAAGQRVANGAVVSLVCDSANPTPYPEWPDPATRQVVPPHAGCAGPRRPDGPPVPRRRSRRSPTTRRSPASPPRTPRPRTCG